MYNLVCCKIIYSDFKAAQQAVDRINRRAKQPNGRTRSCRIYHCKTCRQWHITSQTDGYQRDLKPPHKQSKKVLRQKSL